MKRCAASGRRCRYTEHGRRERQARRFGGAPARAGFAGQADRGASAGERQADRRSGPHHPRPGPRHPRPRPVEATQRRPQETARRGPPRRQAAGCTLRQGPAAGVRQAARPTVRDGVRPARVPTPPAEGRRDPQGTGTERVSRLRRCRRGDPRRPAVSGRTPPGPPHRAPLRHRGRALLAVPPARAGASSPPDLRRPRGGRGAARPRHRLARRRIAHRDGRAAGQGRRPAADEVRPAGHRRRPRSSAASNRPRRRAGLPGTLPAGPQRAGGHGGRNGLACHQAPLAVDGRHPGDHRLRHLPRPRVQGRGHPARDRLRRRARARRLAGVPALQGFATKLAWVICSSVAGN